MIADLREFGSQQQQSQQIADRGSLERAAELMRLYEDRSWMHELPAPPRRSRVATGDFRWFMNMGHAGIDVFTAVNLKEWRRARGLSQRRPTGRIL